MYWLGLNHSLFPNTRQLNESSALYNQIARNDSIPQFVVPGKAIRQCEAAAGVSAPTGRPGAPSPISVQKPRQH